MGNISIIVCTSMNGVIGINGGLAYHIPEDLRNFRNLTMGHTVIMGRKTFESLPNGPLSGRRNIVVTSNEYISFKGCDTAHSIEEALEMSKNDGEVFIIGGEQIYKKTIPLASTIYLTGVYEEIIEQPGNTYAYFDGVPDGDWKVEYIKEDGIDINNGLKYSIIKYTKQNEI